jgi:hypothetical protein
MPDADQGWDKSVRGTTSKGRFVQGAQHPRTFGRGHIGRGHINPASMAVVAGERMDKDDRKLKLLVLLPVFRLENKW